MSLFEGKKILISINTSWNIYNFRRGLLKFLKNSGFEIIALAPKDSYSEKLESELGLRFIHLQMNQKGSNPIEDLILYKEYIRILKFEKPDICLFYTIKPNIYGSLAAARLSIPFINNISGLGTVFIRRNFTSIIAEFLYRIALKKSSHIFFQNNSDHEIFRNKKLINHQDSSILPGSGIDLDYFKADTDQRHESMYNFILMARLIYDKGIREYLEAAKAISETHKNVKFHLLGKSESESNLGFTEKGILREIEGYPIEWHGEQEDVRPFLNKMDVIVLPSYREGMSKALLEASAMSMPIIASNTPGCKELVLENENGYLCEIKNAMDLKLKMELMIQKSKVELKEMGLISRNNVVRNYSENLIFDAYLNVITEKLK